MIYAIIYALVGVAVGVWRVRAFRHMLNHKYPRVAGPLFEAEDVVVMLPWSMIWPLILPLDLLWNHLEWKAIAKKRGSSW